MKRLSKYLNESIELLEVGDASVKSYKYAKPKKKYNNFSSDQEHIQFVSDSGLKYIVDLKEVTGFLEIGFRIDTGREKDKYTETNRGELFKIMSTVVSIAKDAISNSSELRGIRYDPVSKDDKSDNGKKRDRLYRAFISKQFQNAKYIQQGGSVFVTL